MGDFTMKEYSYTSENSANRFLIHDLVGTKKKIEALAPFLHGVHRTGLDFEIKKFPKQKVPQVRIYPLP